MQPQATCRCPRLGHGPNSRDQPEYSGILPAVLPDQLRNCVPPSVRCCEAPRRGCGDRSTRQAKVGGTTNPLVYRASEWDQISPTHLLMLEIGSVSRREGRYQAPLSAQDRPGQGADSLENANRHVDIASRPVTSEHEASGGEDFVSLPPLTVRGCC